MVSSLMKLVFASAGVAVFAIAAHSAVVDELADELDRISYRIDEAELIAMSHEPKAVRDVAMLRLEILELSYALVLNRIQALEGKNVRRIIVAAADPDPDRARQLRDDLQAARDRIAETQKDVSELEGVERSIASIRLESELLTQSQLLLAHYQAKYGIHLPGISDVGTEPDVLKTGIDETSSLPGVPRSFMADEVGGTPLFQRELARGAVASGWWTVFTEPNEPEMLALNYSAYFPSEDSGELLEVKCKRDEFNVAFLLPGRTLADSTAAGGDQPGLEVVHRLDGGKRRFGRWARSPGGSGASLSGAEARKLFFELVEADELMIGVWDVDNNLHSGQFELSGYVDVAEMAVQSCIGQTLEEPIVFARQDYRLIQTLLGIAGYDAGPADGVWGPRSQSAMRQYQYSAGLIQTGHPNEETLELLGLGE